MARVKIDLPASFLFSTEIPVRITDINYGGHLGNDAVLALVHEARVRFLAAHGYSEKNIDGTGIIMVDSVIQYRSESFYGDVLRIDVSLRDFQTTGCDVCYLLTNKETGKEVARAKTGIAFFDYSRRKVVEVPAGFRKLFLAE
jgi:acyl-CoA thioesterase FadM